MGLGVGGSRYDGVQKNATQTDGFTNNGSMQNLKVETTVILPDAEMEESVPDNGNQYVYASVALQ